CGVELGPLRHAVDVGPDLLAREREELLPRPRRGLVDGAGDRERPLIEGHGGRRPGREHGEVVDDVLAGGDPARVDLSPPVAPESTRDQRAHARPAMTTIPTPRRGWPCSPTRTSRRC